MLTEIIGLASNTCFDWSLVAVEVSPVFCLRFGMSGTCGSDEVVLP